MVGQTSESNTAAQRLAASRAPQAATRLRPGSDTGGSLANNGIQQQQRLWRQVASAWEDSWRLSGSCSHLKHEVYGAEPIGSEAEAGAGGGGTGRARTKHKTNGNNLDVWRALVARVPGRSLLGRLLHLRLPLSFGLQVPALPFLEATLLVLCLRLRPHKEGKGAASACCE